MDRSWREPCNECLEDSPAEPAVLRALDTFPEYPEDIPASLTTLLGVLIESDSPSVLQVQVGFNTGDLFLVKDCLHFELRDAAPACSVSHSQCTPKIVIIFTDFNRSDPEQ